MKTEKLIVDVNLKLSAPHYFTKERVEKCVHMISVLHLDELGLSVLETECKTDIPEKEVSK